MKIRPILFSTPMVQAILNRSKTQTRRIIKSQPLEATHGKMMYGDRELTMNSLKNHSKYNVGDIIWVRETWQYSDDLEEPYLYKQKELDELKPEYFKRMTWKPSIFMPKEACRLFLECTNVRVERLQQISPIDAIQEGVQLDKGLKNLNSKMMNSVIKFRELWESINGKESWESSPFVWVYDFKITERPTNFLNNE